MKYTQGTEDIKFEKDGSINLNQDTKTCEETGYAGLDRPESCIERFDKEFPAIDCFEGRNHAETHDDTANAVKSFIESLIAETRQEIIKKIEKWIEEEKIADTTVEYDNCNPEDIEPELHLKILKDVIKFQEGWNSAYSHLKTFINKEVKITNLDS